MYKIHNEQGDIQRLSDMAVIPASTDNTDYQEYLKWLDEGNTPEAMEAPVLLAEEVTAAEINGIKDITGMKELLKKRLGVI